MDMVASTTQLHLLLYESMLSLIRWPPTVILD
jgi:hypothetical protein